MLESHSEIFIEATVRRTIVIHTADRFKIELPGIISLRNLLLAAARLEASTPPPQALPLQSGIPEWEQSGVPFRTKFPSIPKVKFNWPQGNTNDGKNKKILPS